MKIQISRWLSPPVFEGDEEKTFRASLLNAVIIICILFVLFVITGNLIGGRIKITIYLINGIMFVVIILLRILMFNGKVILTGILFNTTGFIIITAGVFSLGTIRTPTTSVFLLLVIIAGLLFGLKGIVINTILSSMAVLGLILAENAGILPNPDYIVTITQWTTFTFLFGLTGALIYYSNNSIQQSLSRIIKESSERSQAEKKLRESELFLRTVIDSVNVPMHFIDSDLIVRLFNKKFVKWCEELDIEIELFDRSISEVFHFLSEETIEQYRHVLKTNRPVETQEDTLINGQLIITKTRKIPVEIRGKVTGVLTIVIDITEREQAGERLKKSLEETERMNRLMTGREMRIIEMKKEVNSLLNELGRRPKFGDME